MNVGFADFYRSVHGHDPFPWQSRLANDVVDIGRYPDSLDIPTGLGKTSLLDVAVWVAARTGCASGSAGRRRVYFIIDRRVVVDEAFDHALKLQHALRATDGPSAEVGKALRSLSGDGSPNSETLTVERMRGGATWSWRWMDRPDRAAVVVGTVDQLGSRFLFRGYGLKGELAPIDAALVGTDSAIIIDEAHLSTPLIDTIEGIAGPGGLDEGRGQYPRPLVVPMSATVQRSGEPFRIDDRDRNHPVARKRLRAPKQLQLAEATGSAAAKASRTVGAMATIAIGQLTSGSAVQAVGVVCNTVGRAREVFERVRATVPRALKDHVEIHLLTGRVRGWDRDRIREEVWPLASIGRDRASQPPTIIVATQTIEVGANLDFDALVTESASLDALVQRLGRLNRLGSRDLASAVVVHDGLDDFLYGDARSATLGWLASLIEPCQIGAKQFELGDAIDVSSESLAAMMPEDRSSFSMTPARHPVLIESHLDTWAMTSPRPRTDVPTAPFLHGYQRASEEVRLVWRSDLGDPARKTWQTVIAAAPPAPNEELAISLASLRRWVRGEGGAGELADVLGSEDTAPEEEVSEPEQAPQVIRAIQWEREAGGGQPEQVQLFLPKDLAKVRPGDLLILESASGGCDSYGWHPEGTTPVPDVADLAGTAAMLRLIPTATLWQTIEQACSLATGHTSSKTKRRLEELATVLSLDPNEIAPGSVQHALSEVIESIPKLAAQQLLHLAGDVPGDLGGEIRWIDRDDPDAGVIWSPTGSRSRRSLSDIGDPAGSSYSRGEVTLACHLDAVDKRARSIATALDIEAALIEAVSIAAAWHDVGKLDHRFQIMLRGGDDLAAGAALHAGAPLAKSELDPTDRAAWRQSFEASRLPPGFRHEVGSAIAVAHAVADRDDLDRDLIVHLVAAHHGRSRPLAAAVEDTAPSWPLVWQGVEVTYDPSLSVDWAGPSRFEQLNGRYGRWGLALLETIVRLADIGCSEEGT